MQCPHVSLANPMLDTETTDSTCRCFCFYLHKQFLQCIKGVFKSVDLSGTVQRMFTAEVR